MLAGRLSDEEIEARVWPDYQLGVFGLTHVPAWNQQYEVLVPAKQLESDGIPTRVVSMPSWELFAKQDPSYREEVLPRAVAARLSIEAGSKVGWERWVGDRGDTIGLERFGASAPGEIVMKELGFNVENVVEKAKALLK